MERSNLAKAPIRADRYDAIVLGLGAMGSAAAWQLAQRGLRTLGIEQYQPAHDRGSSHGESRIIRQAYFEGSGYVPLVLRAYELWRELERRTGTSLLTVTGGLMLGPAGSRTVAGALESAITWGLDHELLDAGEVTRRFPTFRPASGVVALLEHEAGVVLPEAGVRAQLELAQRAGATLRFGEAVLGFDAAGGGWEVRTARRRAVGERLVICPGAWAPDLLGGLPIELSVERQVLYWFEPEGPIAPYLAPRHPVWIWETDDPDVQLYGFPALSPRAGVKVAYFHGGAPCTPGSIDRLVADAEVEAMRRGARLLLPEMPGRLSRAVTCMYTNSPDGHFVVGPLPGASGVVVGCGFSGHGFKFAPAIGELLADLATGARVGPSIGPVLELFDPARQR